MSPKLTRMTSLLLPCLLLAVSVNADKPGCTFHKDSSFRQKKGENQILVLEGNRYHVKDGEYTYYIGICTAAIDPPPEGVDMTNVGVMQVQNDKKTVHRKIVGLFSQTQIIAGPEWVMLEYNGGETYDSHCSHENRTARIMFVCDPDITGEEPVTLLEERRNKTDSCYYLFEIGTAAVCPKQPFITIGLSVGSVLLIVFFSVAGVYLLAGFLYNRYMNGAKGIEQMPNYSFWEDFGNLQADGCNLVCRSRKSREPRTYKGIGDDQLQDEDIRQDENLLPM